MARSPYRRALTGQCLASGRARSDDQAPSTNFGVAAVTAEQAVASALRNTDLWRLDG